MTRCRISTLRPITSSVFCLLALATLAVTQLEAAEPLTVRLQSGRVFTGHVDVRTDAEALTLRFDHGATVIWRPIAWHAVAGAHYLGEEVPADELRELAGRIQSAREQARPAARSSDEPAAAHVQHAHALPRRVHSIQVHAHVASWRPGVEDDGLILHVLPLDDQGQAVPVSGVVSAELIGLRPIALGGRYVQARGEPFPRLGAWTEQVIAEQLGADGYVLKLPFQAMHPEFHPSLASFGMLKVRLAAPGHGVFAATDDLAAIRSFSPIRDELETLSGRRFLPQEALMRNR